ncbi:MAG: hypothetical protein Q7R30_18700 [Acidobacteriota bacterium]|nr:hypothetical protein [Acidobacteriota bacterium]
MRGLSGREQIERFMRALGLAVRQPTRVFLTGGASAVLLGWRETTIDVDLTFVPEADEVFHAIARLKDELAINVELVAPSHFIPALPGWEARSGFIRQEGLVSYYHYDFYSQALAKIERGHAQDQRDVADMLKSGAVEPEPLLALFESIAPELHRYPALNPESFRRSLQKTLARS